MGALARESTKVKGMRVGCHPGAGTAAGRILLRRKSAGRSCCRARPAVRSTPSRCATGARGLQSALVDRYGFTADKVRVFVDETVKTGEAGQRGERPQGVRPTMRKQLTRDDLLLIILLGHGTFDGDVAKFNLVGPDLTAADWSHAAHGHARPPGGRQHHGSQLSVSRAALGRRTAW